MRLREMTAADVEAGLRLCRLSHWNQLARDWHQFLQLTPGGALVAEADHGQVVGTVATMRYARAGSTAASHGSTAHLAWVAMVLVDPAARGQGVGTALLHAGLARLDDVPIVGLDATPAGRPLYEKLGFRVASGNTRLVRLGPPPDRTDGTGAGVRPATAADDDAIAALDARVTGLDRRAMLRWLREGAPELAWVAEGGRRLDGVLLGRRGHAFTHIGPVHAVSTEAALRLLRVVVAQAGDTPLIIDVADRQAGWRHGVEALGFTAQRPFARMYRGDAQPTGDAAGLFAIIGPEFG